MIYDGFSAVLASVLGAMVSTILALVLPTELFLVTLFVGFTFSTIMYFQFTKEEQQNCRSVKESSN